MKATISTLVIALVAIAHAGLVCNADEAAEARLKDETAKFETIVKRVLKQGKGDAERMLKSFEPEYDTYTKTVASIKVGRKSDAVERHTQVIGFAKELLDFLRDHIGERNHVGVFVYTHDERIGFDMFDMYGGFLLAEQGSEIPIIMEITNGKITCYFRRRDQTAKAFFDLKKTKKGTIQAPGKSNIVFVKAPN